MRPITMKYNRTLNQCGDTIVEVFIALTIISSVLAGAFGITRNSTIAERQSQERSEALQVLQGQIEALRADSQQINTFSTSYLGYFCMSPTTLLPVLFNPMPPLKPNPLKALPGFYIGTGGYPPIGSDFAHSPCIVNNADESMPAAGDEPAFYHLSIYVNTKATGWPTLKLQAIWDSVSGQGQDSVQLSYRLQ